MGLLIFLFLVMFAVALIAATLGLKYLETQGAKQVSGMLRNTSGTPDAPEPSLLLKNAPGADQSIGDWLARFQPVQTLDSKIQQAALDWSATRVIFMMVAGAVIGALLSLKLRIAIDPSLSMFLMAAGLGSLPYLYVMRKRTKRLAEFEEQFPDALDFLARSLRAGHALIISLEMLTEESPEPLAAEFRQLYNEQNLGAPVDVALKNLARRVPLLDVRFFVSALMLQRETGGNLSEILNKLSYVIRERFRLKGQVRAVSAHGRITGLILTVLPIALALGLMVVAPEYLKSMANDSDGKKLLIFAVAGQFVGYMLIRKIINIKV